MKRNILVASIVILFIVSALSPMVFGYNIATFKEESMNKDFNRNLYPEFYDCYNIDEISGSVRPCIYNDYVVQDIPTSENVINIKESPKLLDDPMDSPWPMYCHDTRHTGRSPYNTMDNNGFEKWRFDTGTEVDGGIAIDNDGIIYVGANDLYAIYPNGTLKWKYDVSGWIQCCCPAIDADGTIYVGTVSSIESYLEAIYPNGTLKWKYPIADVYSSPVIGDDSTIYFGDSSWEIKALYINGTLKWSYKTDHVIYSSPAIGSDGTIYCGCHDTYLYAFYPNNGTVKWKYKTGHWIRTSPCVADDETIYVVSLDNYLHAVRPDGSLKWKTDVGAGTSPTIGQDGTIYAGYSQLYAINPTDGSVKWTFDPGPDRTIRGATPCNSVDGTIYFGTSDGGEIIAVNPDGTEKWRKNIGGEVESPPAIREDGTVYVGSLLVNGGYLHAFGHGDINHPPEMPVIDGPASGVAGTPYDYMFSAADPEEDDVYLWVEWGDETNSGWIGPYPSGMNITVDHTWNSKGIYSIKVKARDGYGHESDWSTLEVSMPKIYILNPIIELLMKIVKCFPFFEKILNQILI